jgi:1-acyl-sn-glycerol-3-phosphate acyltransferase
MSAQTWFMPIILMVVFVILRIISDAYGLETISRILLIAWSMSFVWATFNILFMRKKIKN